MVITVDIGGTKTLVASFSGHELVREDRFATPREADSFFADLFPLLKAHAGQHPQLQAISIAAPGIIDHHKGSVKRFGNLPWVDLPLKQLLRDQGYDCPILLDNDANLAALNEAHCFSPIPQTCLYITVSTGIGGGVIINGRITPPLSNTEPGHMMLRRGRDYVKWQDVASGRALVERTGRRASQLKDAGLWREHAGYVADGLLTLIPTLQPSVVVIGGGVGAYLHRHWLLPLEEILQERMPSFIDIPPIVQAEQPDEAVIYGCKIYAEQHLGLS